MTKVQLQLVHVAKRQLALSDERYRLILRNVGKVASSRDLDQVAFENVMAFFEECGFRQAGEGETYWRDKADRQGKFASSRQVYEIRRLAADPALRYPLSALCKKWSEGRTWQPEKLTPGEAHKLIEMLKDCVKRSPSFNGGPQDRGFPTAGPPAPAPAPAQPDRDIVTEDADDPCLF